MATQFTESQLQSLKNAYASGLLEVRYDDGNVTRFDSESALLKRIKFIELELYGKKEDRIATAKLKR